jgi:AbrB family looped-hinge helix DNA binding protein
MNKPKATRRRDGKVTVTKQGQISIPRQIMREAGIQPGDKLQASVDESGRLVLARPESLVDRFAGCSPGGMTQEDLQRLRDEWDQ